MKRRIALIAMYLSAFIITAAIVFILAGPFIYWKLMPDTPLNIWIVDKTVPIPDYREHKGLMWAINHNKILNDKTKMYFRYDKDYFGFFPVNKGTYDIKSIPYVKELPQLIYLTDTYGVYSDDYLIPNLKGTRSDLIYGGLSSEEMTIIKKNIGNGNTLIGEFNIASAPTNAENRKELGDIFGVSWKGWKGRYFNDLSRDIEVPVWAIDNYEKQYKKAWEYTGQGFVLTSDSDEIVVLECEKHIGKQGLRVAFNEEYKVEFHMSNEVNYQYWFEFLEPEPGREILANYKLDLTEAGKKVMDSIGLPAVFPAMVRFENTQYTSYYFAGDYSDIQNVNNLWNYYGIDKIKRITSSFNKKNSEYFYWNCYTPVINKILADIKEKGRDDQVAKNKSEASRYTAIAEGNGFKVLKNGKWEKLFIKGVNIGAALPGKWFTEFPQDEEIYLNWFHNIADMNANSIRVYTLLPPSFYNALAYYNNTNPKSPLWLFQEIWPEENPEGHDYLKQSYVDEYYKEIKNVADAIHGKANIPKRIGRAYGIYTSDVSPYVLGFLVGRELEPDEVIATNDKNKGFSYKGDYLSSGSSANATEAWLAMSCDYLAKYEDDIYKWQHPISIVSWPTLDITEHDSEWNSSGLKSLEYNDKVSIDINNIEVTEKAKAGFFGAYHIYPNYPDFMNNEVSYDKYSDEEGRFRYGGYLKEFIEKHTRYPALVAEFGLATGTGNAHYNPDGYNHGGLTEEQQGKGIVRMMKAIKREGYAGGLIFEWIDEWAKKTWITEPFMIPYERHVFWHNAIDPEQNYGIIAVKPKYEDETTYSVSGSEKIQKVEFKKDAAYLYINITLNDVLDLEKERLYIGLDTYDRKKGDYRFSPNTDAVSPYGLEFIIDLRGHDDSRLLVHPGYNIAKGKYSSYESSQGIFEEILFLTNSERVRKNGTKIKAIYHNGSHLNYGRLEENSFYNWYTNYREIYMRIPWGRLNFSDPSSLQVLNDTEVIQSPKRDEIKTITTDGIMFSILMVDTKTNQEVCMINSKASYLWKPWTEVEFEEKPKNSYKIIKDYFDREN